MIIEEKKAKKFASMINAQKKSTCYNRYSLWDSAASGSPGPWEAKYQSFQKPLP
jgi:hypothetical protein